MQIRSLKPLRNTKLEWLKTSPIARIIMVYTIWAVCGMDGKLQDAGSFGIIIIFNWLVMFYMVSLRLCIAAYAGVVITPFCLIGTSIGL